MIFWTQMYIGKPGSFLLYVESKGSEGSQSSPETYSSLLLDYLRQQVQCSGCISSIHCATPRIPFKADKNVGDSLELDSAQSS